MSVEADGTPVRTFERATTIASIWGSLITLLGAFIVVAPKAFYRLTPGLATVSVYDNHLLRDVGITYLAFGISLILARRGPARIAIAACFAFYLSLHAVLHVALDGARSGLARVDLPDVFGIAAFAGSIAFVLAKNRQH